MRVARLLVAGVVLAGGFSAPAGAAGEPTRCTAQIGSVSLEPGVGAEPSSGSFQNEEDGTIECDGPVNGKKTTGPGVWTSDVGYYGTKDPDSCTSGGEGDFIMAFTFPTADGPERFGVHATFTYGALKSGVIGGEFSGNTADGTFTVSPKQGDCATAPVTLMSVDFELVLKR